MSGEPKPEKLGIIDKATIQGTVALIVALAVTGTGVYQFIRDGKSDLLLLVAGGALGYLFKQK